MKAMEPLTLTGERGTYVLEIGTNTFCRLEDLTGGVSFTESLAELQGPKPRMALIRLFVKAALVTPAEATLEEVGRIIDDIGGVDGVAAALIATGGGVPQSVSTTAAIAGPVAVQTKRRRTASA